MKYFVGICLFIIFTLTGCNDQDTQQATVQLSQAEFHVPKGTIELSIQDKKFIKALNQSINSVQSKMVELETTLQEMEGQDEYHEAEEMMKQAKQDILYHWNYMHNQYKPEHPHLKEIKDYYEGLLSRYREGLTFEMEGMETGDPIKMKLGYQKSESAIGDLKRFKQELEDSFPSFAS